MSAGPFWVGDIPAEDLVVEPSRRGGAVDLDPFDDVDIMLFGPDRVLVESSGFLATIAGPDIVIEWPADSVLDIPGTYTLVPTLVSDDGPRERVDSLQFVVQQDDGWHTLDSARALWEQAPRDDVLLESLLTTARIECIEYAPRLADGAAVPANYRAGQLEQARNTLNASNVSPGGDFGDGSFVVSSFPLDWKVRQLLRPKRGVPNVG